MNDHSTEDKLALQKRGEQTNAGAAKYSESIGIGLAWAKETLPAGTYKDLATLVNATLKSNDPNRYEQAARALSGMMDKLAYQQKAFKDATEGSKVTGDAAARAFSEVRDELAYRQKAFQDASSRLNNNVQYAMNTLKTYGYSQQVLDSLKQNINKILANTKDPNSIGTANEYIYQFLGDKSLAWQDLRRKAGNKPGKNPSMSDDKIDALWKELSGNTAGGTQGVQGAQAGNAVAGGGVQGSNNRSGKKPRMSDAEINAFLKEELGIDTTDNGAQGAKTDNGAYASAGVAKGGTKTVGYDPYDPNPGNVSLAYAMRNAPEQERKAALIDEWNKEHGISYVTGKDGVIYRIDPQHPNGYVDPFKNDLSTWISATGYATGKGMLTSGSNGTYATGEGIETPMPANASGKFRSAWKDPMSIIALYGRRAFTDDEYKQLVNHAVNDLGFNENIFSGDRYK